MNSLTIYCSLKIIICLHLFSNTVVPMVTSVYPEVEQMNYTVNASNPVTFSCTATGIPAPMISFRRNGAMLFSDLPAAPTTVMVMRDSDNERVFQVTQTLLLNTTMDADSGMYECLASNGVGNNSAIFELIVQGEFGFYI